MKNDMSYTEAQMREYARDLIELQKVHQVSYVGIIDKFSAALEILTDADPQEVERVFLIVTGQEK